MDDDAFFLYNKWFLNLLYLILESMIIAVFKNIFLSIKYIKIIYFFIFKNLF
jgi:hypothetical protein